MKRNSASFIRFASQLLITFFVLCMTMSAQAVDVGFLNSHVNEDGSIALPSDLTLPQQSSVEALQTFKELGTSNSSAAVSARSYLANVDIDDSTENLASLILTSSISEQSQALAELYRRQNEDGGFGTYQDYNSDVLSSAYALAAMAYMQVTNQQSRHAIEYLLAQQNADGSWSFMDNNNRVELSAITTLSLWQYRASDELGNSLNNAINYLSSQRQDNGLWTNTEASARSLAAILKIVIDRAPYSNTLSSFAAEQNNDGSFDGDVFLTALGLRVLDASAKAAPDEIILSGRVLDADSGNALTNVNITFSGAETRTSDTDSAGNFEFKALTAGTYNVEVQTNGFQTLSLTTLLQTGSKTHLGDLQLSRQAIDPETGEPLTTATIIGTVTDQLTSKPIANATVALVNLGLSTITNAKGVYQLNAVPSGTVNIQVTASGYTGITESTVLKPTQTLVFSPALRESTAKPVSLQGYITDSNHNLALAGVQVSVIDGDNHTLNATTDNQGHYVINDIVAGELSITASLDDYHPASASAQARGGAHLTFSPKMTLLTEDEISSNAGLTGVIMDVVSGRGLAGALLTLAYGNGDTLTLVSGQDGEFSFTDLPIGNVTLQIEMADYLLQSEVFQLQSALIMDAGQIAIQPVSDEPTGSIVGHVIDVRTEEAISGAVISAHSTAINVTRETISDRDGVFSLPAISAGEYDLSVSYSDYNKQTFSVVISSGNQLDLGEIRLREPGVDALLSDLAVLDTDISEIVSDQATFSVSGNISGTIINRGNMKISQPFDVLAFEDISLNGKYDAEVDTVLGRTKISLDNSTPLEVDGTLRFSVSLSGTQSFYSAPVSVYVDANNALAELSEANNINTTAGQCANQQKPSLDLALCMDSSGSVSSADFQLQLEGAAQAIENEKIVPRDGSVRISALQFSYYTKTELEPTIIEEDNVKNIADAIRSIRQNKGGTKIHSCIAQATDLINQATPSSLIQVIDVSTDGQSPYSSAVNASNNAKSSGIDVLNSIAIGNSVDNDLLNAIVFPQPAGGERGFVININNYQEYIDGIARKIQLETEIPDLTLGGLTVTDNGYGADMTVSMTIGNSGSGDVSDALTITLSDVAGNIIATQEYHGGLISGASSLITITGIAPNLLTEGQLHAEVTASNGFVECNQDNNHQQIDILPSLGSLQLSLNSKVVAPNTNLELTSGITNTGVLAGNYRVSLVVLDAHKELVDEISTFTISELAANDSATFEHAWNTSSTIAGDYVVRATLLDVSDQVLSSATAEFTISELLNEDGSDNGTSLATARAATDRQIYHIDDSILLDSLVKNTTSIHAINDAVLSLSVSAPDGAEMYHEDIDLSAIAPSQVIERTRQLPLNQVAEGNYQYRVTLKHGDHEYASSMTTFSVVNDLNAAVKGSVSVQFDELSQGETQSCVLELNNTGTADITALDTHLMVVNVDNNTEVLNEGHSFALGSGASTNQLQSFSTSDFELGQYACVLQATIGGDEQTLAYAQFEVQEAAIKIESQLSLSTQPRLLVLVDPQEQTCTANQSITLEATFKNILTPNAQVNVKTHGIAKNLADHEQIQFDGSSTMMDINEHRGQPDIAIVTLDQNKVQIRLSASSGLLNNYHLKVSYPKAYHRGQRLLKTGLVKPVCGAPIKVGDHIGDFTVVALENMEVPESSHGYRYQTRLSEQPALINQHQALEQVLTGFNYTLVDNQADFVAALSSGRYQQYLLLADAQPLSHWSSKFLREAINRGEGIVYAAGRVPETVPLLETLGIATNLSSGLLRHLAIGTPADGVRMNSSPLLDAQDINFSLDRYMPLIQRSNANLAGVLLNPEQNNPHVVPHGTPYNILSPWHNTIEFPAVTYQSYGKGKAVYFAYDVLAELTEYGVNNADNLHQSLLLNALNYSTPNETWAWSGAVRSLQAQIQNLGQATPATATLTWPEGSELLGATPDGFTVSNEQISWPLNLLEDDQLQHLSWAIPAYTDSQAVATLQVAVNDTVYSEQQLSLDMTTSKDLNTILAELDQSINHSSWVMQSRLWTAAASLRQAQRLYNEHHRHFPLMQQALIHLLLATSQLKDIDQEDIQAIRQEIDILLWQWAQEVPSWEYGQQ